MKKVIIDNGKMVKLFVKKEDIVEKAKKIEKDYEEVTKKYEEVTKKYEEDIKRLTNQVGKIDTKLRPMITTEQSKITMGEYDELQRVHQDEGKVIFEILTPDGVKEEYIERFKQKKEEAAKAEKEASKKK